jgi:uncharacterized membrane protein YkvA (DUF1232 family)
MKRETRGRRSPLGSPVSLIARWKGRARQLKTETHALYLACRDPRVPWPARLFAAIAIGYVFSPIDLIPDFIPVIGYLDDLVLVPIFIVIARRLIPPDVLAEHREHAQSTTGFGKPKSWAAAGVIVAVWLLLAVVAIMIVARLLI